MTGLIVAAMVAACSIAGRVETSLVDWTADGVAVSVPHTWNAVDAAGGEDIPPPPGAELYRHDSTTFPGYARKVVSYRRGLPDKRPGRRYFFRSEGASIKAALRVNGQEAGRHVGAFTGFTFEITALMKDKGNEIEVLVDNRVDADVPPVCADFSMCGGLYRPCRLIEADESEAFDPTSGLFADERKSLDGLPRCEIRADGFYVDGVKTVMRGVCYHQDTAERGWAMTPEEEERDIRLIKEMGANAIRTSHYPRGPHFYELCDRYGIYVWTEVPLVDAVTPTQAFRENTLACAREMVEQNRKYKCIAMWGLFNELYLKKMPDGTAEPLVREVNGLIKSLDPTRPTVCAIAKWDRLELNAISDAAGLNDYPGWYGGVAEAILTDVERCLAYNHRTTIAVSEFGAGGSVKQHENPLVSAPDPGSRWHPEERETDQHIRQYRVLRDDARIWGFYVWQMFDSASDSRCEGDANGINDKGLVTRDRQVKKDAYFFYKANWNPEPMVHLCSSRMTETTNAVFDAIGFCNAGDVTLFLNGAEIGTKGPDAVKTVRWEGVPLAPGLNRIVLAAKGGSLVSEMRIVRKVPGLASDPFPEWSAPRRLTDGPHEHFLANYFGIDCWSPNRRYVCVLETDVNGRLPAAGERCTVALVDTEDGNRILPVATTACWNFQEAAMVHWMDDDTILFNDLRDGKFVTVVLSWRTGAERVLPRPVSAVSKDRTWALSLNYARLSLTRPDYGYAGEGQDPLRAVEWPEDDGLWRMDLATGESKLILSVAAARDKMPPTKPCPDKPGNPLAYFCHTVISADGERIFFLARSVDWYDERTHMASRPWQTTSFTVDADGRNLSRCFGENWGGSHFNWAPDGSHRMLVTAFWNGGKECGHVELDVDRTNTVRHLCPGILDWDGHCIYSPDMKFMSTDGYWNGNWERTWVQVRLEDGAIKPEGTFGIPEAYRGDYWRCDLHPRYRPDGRQIAFNSVHEGSRQVYVRDIAVPDRALGKGVPAASAKSDVPAKAQWFADARFGLFIHWGIYSIPAKGEWIYARGDWKPGEYEGLMRRFNPGKYDPRDWARRAKAAGMKYAVLTTRHHDGFCMFDSHFTDYKVTNSPYGKDAVRAFVEAFRAEGLKVGFYHSLPDWTHRGYEDPESPEYIRFKKLHVPTEAEKKAFRELLYNHVHQLMTEYGKIDLLFFDYTSKYKTDGNTFDRDRLLKMVRECQPEILVNDRLSFYKDAADGFDYYTPEITVPSGPIRVGGRDVLWETCATMNDSWGYRTADSNWKTPEAVVAGLVGCVSRNGNLLLNIGPTELGEIPEGSVRILDALAQWNAANGESVTGCGSSRFVPPFGCAYTQRGNDLYLHFLQPPLGDTILPGLRGCVAKATVLRTGEPVELVNLWGFELLPSEDQRIRTRGLVAGDVIKIELK